MLVYTHSKTLYLIRHCRAAGQQPDAPLTIEGQAQAEQLATRLIDAGIERIISSPFVRAYESIKPLAQRLALLIETDERLIERVLCASDLADWRTHLAASFADLDLCLAGGESSRAAMQRGVAALDDALRHPARVTAIVSHGNLVTLLLKHFDQTIGFDHWQQMTNPDVFEIVVADQPTITRLVA